MAFKLIKTNTVVHNVPLTQVDGDGKEVRGSLRVRYKVFSRSRFDEITASDDDSRLIFDEVVDAILDEITDDAGNAMSNEQAIASLREDMALSAQIGQYWLENVAFGAAAKNAKRSRAR